MTKTYSQAYDTGYEAHERGETRDANNYAAGTWESDEWYAGWDAADWHDDEHGDGND